MAGMGHAVMGTAVSSGENRAIEAAQAAMASPLLEAGAIDGARGILINITGSSSLKLSEVNEASSLIQSAAHEDANIIFGAVLDEKMGEEVKITVIATGFRDQMPERRARMLSVEEAPVVSVPVVAPDNWLGEPVPAPAPLPFQSQMEEEQEEADEPFRVEVPATAADSIEFESTLVEAAPVFDPEEMELVATPARPKFDELSEEPTFTPLPRDYASDFGSRVHPPAGLEGNSVQPTAALFAESGEEAQPDLDTPAFMRRLKF
jgi:cell division protein FtsZ